MSKTLKQTVSAKKLKPKTRMMSMDIDKPKNKLKVQSSLVNMTTGPKTPIAKKSKIGISEKLKTTDKGKSTVRRSTKKINSDLPGSP
jgi:hypothetical protein